MRNHESAALFRIAVSYSFLAVIDKFAFCSCQCFFTILECILVIGEAALKSLEEHFFLTTNKDQRRQGVGEKATYFMKSIVFAIGKKLRSLTNDG